jgi:hypothetical protein
MYPDCFTRLKSHILMVCSMLAPTEGDQCAHTAVRDRRCHRFEADTEAGLGRTRFIRVCFMICTAHKVSYRYS